MSATTTTTPAPFEVWRPLLAGGRYFPTGGTVRCAVPFEIVDLYTDFYGRGRVVSVIVPDGTDAATLDVWLASAFPAGRSPRWLTTRAWVGDTLIEAGRFSATTLGGERLPREQHATPATMGAAILWTVEKVRQARKGASR